MTASAAREARAQLTAARRKPITGPTFADRTAPARRAA